MSTTITYHGWSSLAVESPEGKLVFDPFWRPYGGARWFGHEAFDGASVRCVTHGHAEAFLDTPDVVERTGGINRSSSALIIHNGRR
jgi:L-ascorbate metabolism protein UlaG (beta-lactamase superfamily)